MGQIEGREGNREKGRDWLQGSCDTCILAGCRSACTTDTHNTMEPTPLWGGGGDLLEKRAYGVRPVH